MDINGLLTEGNKVGTVEFKNVNFRYPNSKEDELENINFDECMNYLKEKDIEKKKLII